MPEYYIVFSPKSEYYKKVEEIVLDQTSSFTGKYILVKEYGKKSNHEHLNLVYQDKISKKNINRKWVNIFNNTDPTIIQNNHKLIKCTTVFNKEKLIQGYLNKEEDSKVLKCRYYKRIETEDMILKKENKELQQQIDSIISDIRLLIKKERELSANAVERSDLFERIFLR